MRTFRSASQEVAFGNSPDLQGRGTAGHNEPGSDCAVEARSRHRSKERVEHDRRGRRPPVRRTACQAAQHRPADRRHLCRNAGAEERRQEAGTGQEGARAAQARGTGAAPAAPGKNRQAGRAVGTLAGRRGTAAAAG